MLLDQLRSIVGGKNCSDDADVLEPHVNERRGRLRGKALAMVSPQSTDEVSGVIKACVASGVGVVPQGGNTGLCGGAIPDDSGEQVLLSMSRMNKIRAINANDFSITVEAGCILANVQDAARTHDRLFPLSLGAEGSCQIGGNLSTNAGGINVVRYGTARTQVLGLEVVLADGKIWNGLRSLRKDTAGYDMKQIFVGSEGTLGVITAATLKLYPPTGETATVLIALQSAHAAVELLAQMRTTLADRIQAFELMSDRCLRFVERHIADATSPFADEYPWFVLCEVATGGRASIVEDALTAASESELISDAIIAKNQGEADKLWRIRHSISEAQKFEGASLKHDISVPIGQIGDFLAAGDELIASMQPTARLVAFGHVGDGNLHYNVTQAVGANSEQFLQEGEDLTRAIYDRVAESGGSISAEHGIGVLKKHYLQQYRSDAELELMRVMKKALDPKNTLNPGKVI